MGSLFVSIYWFFTTRKALFWIVFIVSFSLISLGAFHIRLEEDITRIFPEDERSKDAEFLFQNSRFVDRLVVMVSVRDSMHVPDPDELVAVTDDLVGRIEENLSKHITLVAARVDDTQVMEVISLVQQYLPIFLSEEDYERMDSITRSENIEGVLFDQYRQLVSPAGIVTKRVIMHDLPGFSNLALRKLQALQYDQNFELYDNYVITKDHRHLVFFIQPAYKSNDTKNNALLIDGLDEIIENVGVLHPDALISAFGASLVAVGNARQLRSDTFLTVGLTVVLLAGFILSFFRRKRTLLLIFIPVVFGGVFSLACIYLLKGTVSILAVAAGSVVLGIAINYSLHFLVHLKYTGSNEQVIRDLAKPMTIGSATTVLAFLLLQFVNASVLRDVGLFAAFSLIGAGLCSLVFLPHLVHSGWFSQPSSPNWVERINFVLPGSGKYAVGFILLLTPVFFYFAKEVGFNSDMSKLNFMRQEVGEAGERLERITRTAQGALYVVADGPDLEHALRQSERNSVLLNTLHKKQLVDRFNTVSDFLLSDSLQRVRIDRWHTFWTDHRKKTLMTDVREAGRSLKFSEVLYQNLDSLLNRSYVPATQLALSPLRKAFFDDYIIEREGKATVLALANVTPGNRSAVYQKLEQNGSRAFDRQLVTNLFVEYVNADFTFIVTVTSILVFIALLISYGRIELTLIAFIPMLITWIWILGLMALLGIEFNIVNVMISTFIFGLGDDYSIFILDGLQEDHRVRKKNLPSIRISVFLSALTTVCGLGVLIFAQHPALRSVATIAIIGIASVFVMAQTVEPFLFRWLISNRTEKGMAPMTLFGIIMTTFTYGFFVAGSFLLTLVGIIFKLVPFAKKELKLVYHHLIRAFTWTLIYVIALNVRKKVINKTHEVFSGPNVLISNHSSFLDILFVAMLHHKVILLTNKWVWNSPVFGGVVRMADYYPVMEGAESGVGKLQDRAKEGYSIAVFPEGTRSPDGKIGRFHKGAFYMAEVLKVPVLPVLIHGSNDGIRKNEIYLNNTLITMKFLPPIQPDDYSYGKTYQERTKRISKYFKEAHQRLKLETETPDYFRYRLITTFLYKGPVLEWYLRVKLRLEKNYEEFHNLIPRKATVLDLGCGYGFLCYMLQFLSDERVITGVDYDDEKIGIARYGYSRSDRLVFECEDITNYPLKTYDAIVMADVLHYLTPEQQVRTLHRAFEALNPGGRVIIREGNTELKQKHRGTRLTEFFSVRVLNFNKSSNRLYFMSGDTIRTEAARYGLSVSEMNETKYTSNVIFVVDKPGREA